MSRFDDYDYEEQFPNASELWHANAQRALAGKRGKKALAEMREALLALPEKRLIAGALCTVGGVERIKDRSDPHGYLLAEMTDKLAREGEGVCAIGAYIWFKKVKAGTDPQAAFAELPLLLDSDGAGDYETAEAGQKAGLTFTLAWSLAYKNDAEMEGMTPEERYEVFMRWLDVQLTEEKCV